MKGSILAAVSVSAVLGALPAAAQFNKPEDAIKYRKAVFTVMNIHFARVAAMAQGKVAFDAKSAAENAEIAADMSKLPYAAFITGTDKGETRAEPTIWTERDKFNDLARKMQEAMDKLNQAAKSGKFEAVKPAADDVGKACKACHDNYRKQ
jgi:cytochrome c556